MARHSTRIGILTWDFGAVKGGMGRSLQWIASALKEGGFDVRVFSPHASPSFLGMTKHIGGHVLFSLLLPFVLARAMRKDGCCAFLVPVGPGGVWRTGRWNIPYDAVVYHTYEQQRCAVPGQQWKRIFVPLERRTLAGARSVVCFCASTADVLERAYGVPKAKIRLLPHAIETREWGKEVEKEKGLCVCVARLEARKGVRELLDAWQAVHADVPEARLVIVGGGAQAHVVDRMIAKSDSSVRRIAYLPPEELRSLLCKAEVALCPSYLEGFGLAAAEAMTAGTAVIASSVDGLRDLIEDGQTGILVPTGTPHLLTEAITRLLWDDLLRSQMAEQARGGAMRRFDAAHASEILTQTIGRLARSEG